MTNNFWGEPDDLEPLPDWMNPETYRNQSAKIKPTQSLNEAIMQAMGKPPIDLSFVNNKDKQLPQ
jgi:hypothetical protein